MEEPKNKVSIWSAMSRIDRAILEEVGEVVRRPGRLERARDTILAMYKRQAQRRAINWWSGVSTRPESCRTRRGFREIRAFVDRYERLAAAATRRLHSARSGRSRAMGETSLSSFRAIMVSMSWATALSRMV